MALPPAGYPNIRGKRCGQEWTATIVVTGKLPGTAFGEQFKHTIEPLSKDYPTVITIGEDRDAQIFYANKIDDKIDDLRSLVAKQQNFTKNEREQITWLLDRAESYLLTAEEIWDKWAERQWGVWPLSQGDALSDFYGGRCKPGGRGDPGDWGRWISWDIPRGRMQILCPTVQEVSQRSKDRKAIGQLFNDALAHVYCAEYGYWRLRLYKRAFGEYKDLPDITLVPPGSKPDKPTVGPGDFGPGGLVTPTKTVDPCKDFGINCPPGVEPDDCPSGWCVDPDVLPDPTTIDPDLFDEDEEEPVPPGLGTGPIPEAPISPRGDRGALPLLAAGAGTLILTGIAVYALR